MWKHGEFIYVRTLQQESVTSCQQEMTDMEARLKEGRLRETNPHEEDNKQDQSAMRNKNELD